MCSRSSQAKTPPLSRGAELLRCGKTQGSADNGPPIYKAIAKAAVSFAANTKNLEWQADWARRA